MIIKPHKTKKKLLQKKFATVAARAFLYAPKTVIL
jgi:hypothetical protein